MTELPTLLEKVRNCTICAEHLPLGPRPVVQLGARARILIAGQAPGRKVHESGIPFDDASGDRLRRWMGVSREVFHDADRVSILPMGFCYPGSGKSGDLPPRPECAPQWRARLLSRLDNLQMTLVIGHYAMRYHLPGKSVSVTEAVRQWRDSWPGVVPMPHPSPRNNRWLKANPWFEQELVPELQSRIAGLLKTGG
ncbi:uracil-DNA glycosylase family protein [Granulosicoccus sp. 3-233]|uniref:uracil-DNA glycosylase family protein n=1 Tax=Granulosicoccus sp. 3-233 TaxID=3417969 RepID=UPI003D327987